MFALKKMITVAALSLAAMHANAAVLSFSSTASAAGGTDVNVLVSDAVDLYTYEFSIAYDPTMLNVASASTGDFLGAGGTTYDSTGVPSDGELSYVFDTLLYAETGVSGSGTLLSIHFDTLIPGISSLNFHDVLLLDAHGDDLGLTVIDGTVETFAAVPEPTSALLLGIGAVTLLARRRGAFAPKRAA